jgi:alpha-ribazole phosphatase/probable phosphoglycerate mutase
LSVEVVFETHSLSEDNDRQVATGWLPGRLSARGRQLARELGERRRSDGLAAVFVSDLRRAVETAELAFAETELGRFLDWRLRECDSGELNGAPSDRVAAEAASHIDSPFPGGESWREAHDRVDRCLDDLVRVWRRSRVLVIGHVATRWALDRRVLGATLDELVARPFDWREGWTYDVA